MLSKKIVSLISEQIKNEAESAYLYIEIADYFDSEGLCGFAHWYTVQAREELKHAMIFANYLHDNNERIIFYTIEPSRKVFSDYKKPLEESLHHEKFITDCINNIYETAETENDFRTKEFLNWFIKEQQEEECNAQQNLTKMNLYSGNFTGLYLLDKEMGKRCSDYKESENK